MRINTSGNKAYRSDLYERTADVLGENTKTGAIDAACIHARQDLDAKRDTLDYLADELPPEQLVHVADLLSTSVIELDIDLETSVTVDK